MASKFAKCPICNASGMKNYLSHHIAVAHPENARIESVIARPEPQTNANRLKKQLSMPKAKTKPKPKPKPDTPVMYGPFSLAEQVRSGNSRKPSRPPPLQLTGKKKSQKAIAKLKFKRGQCLICGAKMAPDHSLQHRSLILSISRSASNFKASNGGSSVWAVSGGLPSLGKRSR